MTNEERLEADALEIATAFVSSSAVRMMELKNLIIEVAKAYHRNIDEERSLDAQGDALDRGL